MPVVTVAQVAYQLLHTKAKYCTLPAVAVAPPAPGHAVVAAVAVAAARLVVRQPRRPAVPPVPLHRQATSGQSHGSAMPVELEQRCLAAVASLAPD
jgi:hypothetical protein